MLQSIRDRASGWTAYIIIFLISIPFLLWGVNNYFNGQGKQSVAVVDGHPISIQKFSITYRNERSRLEQVYGGKLPAGLTLNSLKQIVLNQMIQNAVLTHEVNRAGYKITNDELLQQLKEYPVFLAGGRFSKTRYLQVLMSQGLSPEVFESELRQSLAIDQLKKGIQNSAFATSQQARNFLRLANEQREVFILSIPINKYLTKVRVSSQEIKNYYDKNKKQFLTPQMLKLAYVEVGLGELEKRINSTLYELKKYYKEHENLFSQPEKAFVREIVININAKNESFSKQRLKEISNGLSKGLSFAELAKRYSEAANSSDGGVMGWVTRNQLPHQVASVVFSLNKGEVSPPILVGGKVYRFELVERTSAKIEPFKKVEAKVKEMYIRAKAQREYNQLIQKIQSLNYQNPASLDPISKVLGLVIHKTGWIGKNSFPSILNQSNVVQAAFSQAVLDKGLNSQLFTVDGKRAIVFRVIGKQPPHEKPLSEVSDQIKTVLVNKKAGLIALQNANEIVKRLQEKNKLGLVEKNLGITFKSIGWIGRGGNKFISPALSLAIFNSPAPSKEHLSSGIWKDANKYVVYVIDHIRHGRAGKNEEILAIQALTNKEKLIQLQSAILSLEQNASIKVYPANLNY